MHQPTLKIRKQIIDAIRNNIADLNNHIQEEFGISRQAVYRHLKNLENEGFLTSQGSTRNKTYQLGEIRQQFKTIKLDGSLDEREVYNQDFMWVVGHTSENIQDIVDWGFTEMLNNVIDHSDANEVCIDLKVNKKTLSLVLLDDGEGIFNRIKRLKNFSNNRQAIIELSKGKLTTDKDNHTGLGIFFSAKAFDEFDIYANDTLYNFKSNSESPLQQSDLEIRQYLKTVSTGIIMQINVSSSTDLKGVFDAFAKAPEFDFDTTIVPLYLVDEKHKLVSRSQAKQVVNRLDEFKYVTFDFKGIKNIGQGFADELFRVYPNKHPEIAFDYINAELEVEKMIKRSKK